MKDLIAFLAYGIWFFQSIAIDNPQLHTCVLDYHVTFAMYCELRSNILGRYVKEGSTVTVMGVVQRHENVLMIVPPPEPMTTGCQWSKFLLPATLEGIILKYEEPSKVDGIPLWSSFPFLIKDVLSGLIYLPVSTAEMSSKRTSRKTFGSKLRYRCTTNTRTMTTSSHISCARGFTSLLYLLRQRGSLFVTFFVLHGCKRYELSQQFVHDILGSGRIFLFFLFLSRYVDWCSREVD